MIVILEGPDGAGKTTLARKLCQAFILEYHHEGPPPDGNPLIHYGLQLQRARGQNVLFDRFAFGERVYGPVLRDVDRLGEEGWRQMQRLIWAAGAHQILCLPSLETCLSNFQSSDKERGPRDKDQWAQTYEAYERLVDPFVDPRMMLYDYETETSDELIARLATYEENTARLSDDMIGHPMARYLFVGERGSNAHLPLDLPFFGITDSALYLNSALDYAGFHEEEIAFINAFPRLSVEPRHIPTDYERVIALGESAAQVCRSQGVEHIQVYHPQYWRRFHYSELALYAKSLERCK